MAGLTATIFVQLASLAARRSAAGWPTLRRRTPRGRMMVQAIGVFAARRSSCLRADAFGWRADRRAHGAGASSRASTMPTSSRRCSSRTGPRRGARAAGVMNTVGWLAGGGSAPLLIGIVAGRQSLGVAIALASVVYLAAAVLLLAAILFFVKRDSIT